jgi:hypothetical protein
VHVRHTWPIASITFGIAVPHGTVAGSAHRPQHSRVVGVVVPGGFTHV